MIHHSLLFSDVRVNNYTKITDSVILPKVEIGRYVKLNKVIIDKQCVIPDGLEARFDPVKDAKQFHVTEKGVTLITPDMLGQHIHMSNQNSGKSFSSITHRDTGQKKARSVGTVLFLVFLL
ncbi:MAG: hypothetical protein WJ310_09410 [Ferrovum myxofaciens]